MRSSLIIALALVVGTASGAEQFVPTKTLLVKNPPSGARKVLWKVRETGSAATLVGDPTADGATLRLVLTPGGNQCVFMPASGWSAVSTIGFKYKDPTLANGPVKVAMVKKTPSGTFLVKALLKNGGPISITVTPGNPTTSYATNFTLGVGDDYCGGTAAATPNPNDAVSFKVPNDGAPTDCVAACLPPACSTLGAACGACGDGVCTTHCESGRLVCVSNGSCNQFGQCGTDSTCVPPPGGTTVCVSNGAACATPSTYGCCQACDATTTTTFTGTTTTTSLPTCSTLGAACGACGDGVCLTHCDSGQLVCLSNGSCNQFGECATDSMCLPPPGGTEVCASNGVACATPSTYGCCQACP